MIRKLNNLNPPKYKKWFFVSIAVFVFAYLIYIFYRGWPMDFDCSWNCSLCHGVPIGNSVCLGFEKYYPEYSISYPVDKYDFKALALGEVLLIFALIMGVVYVLFRLFGRKRKTFLLMLLLIIILLALFMYNGIFLTKGCAGEYWCHGIPLSRGGCAGFITIKNPTFCPIH